MASSHRECDSRYILNYLMSLSPLKQYGYAILRGDGVMTIKSIAGTTRKLYMY